MAEEVPDDFLPAVSRDLLPLAVHGMSTRALPPILLKQALTVITACMKRTALMASEARKDMKQQLKASKQLVPALCSVVSRDLSSADTKYAPPLVEWREGLPVSCLVTCNAVQAGDVYASMLMNIRRLCCLQGL